MCTVVAEVNVYIAVHALCTALRTLGTGHSCVAKRTRQWICMLAHGYHDNEYRSLLRSVTLSPPSKWLSMAPKAMQPTAMKKVQKPAKAMQKNKAKVHKVQKKPSQAQTQESFSEMGDVIEEDQEEEQHEEQQPEQEGECQEHEDETAEKDKSKVSGKEYYRFWNNARGAQGCARTSAENQGPAPQVWQTEAIGRNGQSLCQPKVGPQTFQVH